MDADNNPEETNNVFSELIDDNSADVSADNLDDPIFSESIAVDFKDIKDKLSKINDDLLYGKLDSNNDNYQEYEELFKNKDEIYINNTQQIFSDIKNNMYNVIFKERNQYKKIYNIVEDYIIKNKLLVSNLYKISEIEKNIDSLFDYYYIVYCEISLIHANNIINNIYEYLKKEADEQKSDNTIDLFNADKPSTAIKFLNLKTLNKNEEFSIEYNNKTIVKLYTLQKYNKDIFYLNSLWQKFALTTNIDNKEDSDIFSKIILDDDGILWTRNLDTRDELNILLNSLNCNYMFIGHNVVDTVKFVNNNLWLTDTGISRAFGNKPYQYLDISNNVVSIKTLNN